MAVSGCLRRAHAFGVAACGGTTAAAEAEAARPVAERCTIYSSLPLQGASRAAVEAVVNGAKLALEQAGGKAGKYNDQVRVARRLDRRRRASGTRGKVSANARKAAQDKSTIVVPRRVQLRRARDLDPDPERGRHPADLAVEHCGRPDPSGGRRATGRAAEVLPDAASGPTRASSRRTHPGARRSSTLDEAGGLHQASTSSTTRRSTAQGLADNVEPTAKTSRASRSLGNDGIDTKAANYRSLASKIESKGADCFFFGGITHNNGVQLSKDVAAACPNAKLYGPDGVAESAFVDPKKGGIPAIVDAAPAVTVADAVAGRVPAGGPGVLQGLHGRSTARTAGAVRDLRLRGDGARPRRDQACGRQGQRPQAVVDAVFATKDRQSVLGTYSIDQNGDTTLTDYGAVQIKDGELEFDKVIKAQQG